MKKTIFIIALLALSVNVIAQSPLDDGIKMYHYERYQSAIKELSLLASQNPTANYYLGLSELGAGDINAAKATFSKYPDDAANMSGMARIAFAQNNPTQGMQIAKTVADKAKRKDTQPLQYAADALTYSDGADYQQAIDWYKKALENNSDDPNLHISLGDAYQKISGGGGQAMDNYEFVTGKDQKNSLAYTRIGKLWYDATNYNSALDNFNKAKDADPINPLPYYYLAQAYYQSGKYDLAYQNIQQYMKLSDNSKRDKELNLQILYFSKHYPEAISQAQELISAGDKSPQVYGILGFSQYQAKDTINALPDLRNYFTQMDPKKITSLDYLTYAQAFLAAHQNDSSNFYFNKAISSDTAQDKSGIYRQIAEGFKESKDYTQSAIWYNKIITANPGAPALDYFWTTVMYYYSKDYVDAAKAGQLFESKYPDEQSATYWRGRVGAAQDPEGKEGTAVPFFTKWIDKVGPNYDKKADLKLAYEYLLLYSYQKNDKEGMKKYEDLIAPIDPNDDLVKQIETYQKQLEESKKAPAKGKK